MASSIARTRYAFHVVSVKPGGSGNTTSARGLRCITGIQRFSGVGGAINFDVPVKPGPVISGIRLDDYLLLRRTDFNDTRTDVILTVDGSTVKVPRVLGKSDVNRTLSSMSRR